MVIATFPPKVVSPEEYETIYRPQGWQLLIIGPTSTWRQEWKEWEAIRDIVQNALDETEHYTYGYDDEGLWIADEGKGVAVADFLLGPPRPKPEYARGRFGEGMKIAALSLLRLGYSVRIDTVGKEVWMVFYQQKVNGTADTLAALWKPNGRRHGTVFHIIGYRGPAFEDRFVINIKGHIIHQAPSPLTRPVQRYNQLIRFPAGRLYAREIFMREIKSPWSYNLWGFALAPDRHAPESERAVQTDMGRLWATVDDSVLIQRFLGIVTVPPEEPSAELEINMDSWDMGIEPTTGKRYAEIMSLNKDHWEKAWKAKFGDNAVLRTSSRWDGVVKHLGYASVQMMWSVEGTLKRVITTDEELVRASQERLREVEVVPDLELSPLQFTHLKLARKIAQMWRYPPIVGVHAAIIPPASDRVRTAGLYQRTTAVIYISLEQLDTARKTVDTIIHEIAHHTSGEEDGHPDHNLAMTQVAARIVHAAAEGQFAEELKGAQW